VHFHVNYGQNLGIWDRVFGTYRREGRVYGVDVFGGKGAPRAGARGDEPAPLVDYRRKAARTAVTRLGPAS
jgi:sterol desaturase/sphingolipid hydroxylase (fatty acid hydroxylase superfamily)